MGAAVLDLLMVADQHD